MRKKQNFNDGICAVADLKNNNTATVRYQTLRFEYRTVGEERFFKAAEQNRRIKHVIRIPKVSGIEGNQVFVIDGNQYTAVQVQLIRDTDPACWQVSLEQRNKRIEVIINDRNE